ASNSVGTSAMLFYLAVYVFMVAGAFGVAALVGRTGDGRHSLDDYRGLGRTNPALSAALTVFLLAQAGVPFTSGFLAKFYVIGAAVSAHSYWLGLVAMLSSVITAFVYLRIVLAMYSEDPDDARPFRVPAAPRAALVLCVLAT